MNAQVGQRSGVRGVFAKGTGQHERIRLTDGNEEASDDQLALLVHDLKNPLSSIALEVDLIGERVTSCERLDMAQAIARIRRNVTFLDRLIYDLVDICTLANGRLVLNRAPCDLPRLLAATIDRVVPANERHRVSLATGGALSAEIDEVRIERVVSNLLDNALKYTPASSGITVRLAQAEDRAEISVADTGPGLSANEIDVVFEPYRRAASSRGRSGSGLGLYVSKQIVEAHGGRIGVESVRGFGARFYFTLPLVR